MSDPTHRFPAQAIAGQVCDTLASTDCIVAAPPGAGKSTVLPLALLKHFTDKTIVMLQPRRVVVRSLAAYLAAQLGESVGQTVGYRVRGDSKVGPDTRLEIITEGILARRIAQDPELAGVDILMFDEFHERNIHSDFGLALALEVQQGLRDDLRLLVMSATLDVEAVHTLLPAAAVVETSGRMFEVTLSYTGQVAPAQLHQQVVREARALCQAVTGEVLVFLPGRGAIRAVQRQLNEMLPTASVVVHTLYGAASRQQQQAALVADPQGRQKIILATNVAETSLTIDNIEGVVDSGLENHAQFHPGSGLTQLTQQMISQASADQRLGRAGRLRPGRCVRLWAKEQTARMRRFAQPQILCEDVTALLLEALSWGSQLDELALLDAPGTAQQTYARDTLLQLEAITVNSAGLWQITAYGRQLASLPCQPRLAHALLQSIQRAAEYPGLTSAAAWMVALAEDSGRHTAFRVSDLVQQAEPGQLQRLRKQAQRLLKKVAPTDTLSTQPEPALLAVAILLAYPERLAHRQHGQWKLASGKGAVVDGPVGEAQWLAMLHGQQQGATITVRQAEPVSEAVVMQLFEPQIQQAAEVSLDLQQGLIQARQVRRLFALTLSSEPLASPPPAALANAWWQHLQDQPLSDWPLSARTRQWLNRLALARELALPQPQAFAEPDPWPTEESLLQQLDQEALHRALGRCRRYEQVADIAWFTLFNQALTWPQQDALATLLPENITVPSGHTHTLDYQADGQVILAVRMQEMYGQTAPYTVAQGHHTVTLSLLSPAGRPLQKTQDPGLFWQGSYQQIQKEMKGRYPKHYWPDDPSSAQATTKTKRAMN